MPVLPTGDSSDGDSSVSGSVQDGSDVGNESDPVTKATPAATATAAPDEM